VVFSPTHLSFIKGSPAERRRAIDAVIGQVKPRYITVISEYQRLIMQRNTLLKDISFSPSLIDTLDVWDDAIAKRGALISRIRRSYIVKLNKQTEEIYDNITSGKEKLGISYLSSTSLEEITESDLKKKLEEARETDIRLGSTTVGPHRDDLDITVNGKVRPGLRFPGPAAKRRAVRKARGMRHHRGDDGRKARGASGRRDEANSTTQEGIFF
jgi:DNA replication and repair protein RecF